MKDLGEMAAQSNSSTCVDDLPLKTSKGTEKPDLTLLSPALVHQIVIMTKSKDGRQ